MENNTYMETVMCKIDHNMSFLYVIISIYVLFSIYGTAPIVNLRRYNFRFKLHLKMSQRNESGNENNKRKRISEDKKDSLYNMVYGEGLPIKFVAEQLKLNYSTARDILSIIKRNERKGSSEEEGAMENYEVRRRGAPYRINGDILRIIDGIVSTNPGITLKGICGLLEGSHGIVISKSTVDRALKTLKVTLKTSCKVLDRVNSEDTIEKRYAYASHFIESAPRDGRKLIFVDESGFNLHLRRNKARSKKGERAPVVIPTVRGRNVSLILAANRDEVLHYKIIDDSTCNGNIFEGFVNELFENISRRVELHGS
jgi:transposase